MDSPLPKCQPRLRCKTNFKWLPKSNIWCRRRMESKKHSRRLHCGRNISSPSNCFIRWLTQKIKIPDKKEFYIGRRVKKKDRRCGLYRVFLACILSGSLEKERKLTDFHYKNIRFSRYDFFHRSSRNSAGKAAPDERVTPWFTGRPYLAFSCISGEALTWTSFECVG